MKFAGEGRWQPWYPGCSCIFRHATNNRDAGLTTVQIVPSPGRASKITVEAKTVGHRLAELSLIAYKGELPVVSDTQENREGIAEHLFSINGDVRLPGRFCPGQAEEGCLALRCVKGQSRLIRPSDHFIYFRLLGRHDHVLIADTTGYQQIIRIGTHISFTYPSRIRPGDRLCIL